ncbi:hypothetical protein LPJ63_001197 [Coemansia sp. RSA 2711]|nr:hypothetical protein LPJ63_001197 [Coemansia sp. RSA 2711]
MSSEQETYGLSAADFPAYPAASSGDTHPLLPITPGMGSDALLATQAATLSGLYSSVNIGASTDISGALFGLQGLPMPSEGMPSVIPCENPPALSGPSGDALYSQGYAKLNEHLQGVLGMPSAVSTPPASVSSPEFLSTGSDIATIAGGSLGQIPGLGYAQAFHMHTPLAQDMSNVTIPASEALYTTPIMGSTQLPAEPLFTYADTGSGAAFVPNMASAEHGMQMYAHPQHGLGQSGIPSLVHTPDIFMVNSHAPLASSALADSFGDVSLSQQQPSSLQQVASGLLPFGAVPGQLSQLRSQRSLSISEPARARSSSPSLTRLATMPALSGHPYTPRRNTSLRSNPSDMHAGAQFRRIRSHTRTGSDIVAGCAPGYTVPQDFASWGKLGSPGSTLPSRSNSTYSKSRAASIVPGSGALASVLDSDDGTSAGDDEADSEPQRTPSGRIPLTREQREVFFRWLYENSHDPKPKGSERDRLRCIGNMTRERFKTWFANARRRYFKISYDNGVQQYTVNERFRVACQRANINLD